MNLKARFAAITTALSSLLWSGLALAQQSGADLDVSVNTGGDAAWYGQWYVWAIAVAVFLVLVIALTSRGSRQS